MSQLNRRGFFKAVGVGVLGLLGGKLFSEKPNPKYLQDDTEWYLPESIAWTNVVANENGVWFAIDYTGMRALSLKYIKQRARTSENKARRIAKAKARGDKAAGTSLEQAQYSKGSS